VVALWAPPALAAEAPPHPDARSYLLVDAEDGTELAAKAPERQASIASATKLMTAYVALRQLRLKDELVAPRYQALAAESLLGLKAGERIQVRDLIFGLLLASGNDAAVALAEGASGSVPAFVGDMNRAAARIGLEDTSYTNPIGLDEAGNFSTAGDLVELVLELRRDSFFRKVVDTAETTVDSGARPRRLVNRNNLVSELPFVNGVKTGYTGEAGYVLVGSATRKGVTLVSVVMGAPSESERDRATLGLLDYGFSLYRRKTVVEKGAVARSVPLAYRDEALPIVAARRVKLVLRRGQDVETSVAAAPSEIGGEAVRRGERLGRLTITVDGEEQSTVPLIAARSVEAATIVDRVDASLPGGRLALALLPAAVVLALLGVAWSRSHRRHHQASGRRRRRNGQGYAP
jgi:D-alanyl-D-alanine carboxypeptidase (penicillin-binding protein 5/6)